MQALKITIRYPDARTEEFVVDADRVLIGSGAHCEIRLPVDQAAIEHVAISLTPTGAIAETRAFEPAPTLNGVPFAHAQLLPDAVLGIGAVQIIVSVVEVAGEVGVLHKKQQKTSPMTYIFAAIAVPVSLYIIFSDAGRADPQGPPPKRPELWAAPIASCPQTSPQQALVVAQDKGALADAKRERRPFHVQDGVAAIPLYEQVAACYKVAGKDDWSKIATENAKLLRKQVAEDYRTHHMRLEHSLSVGDHGTAQREVRMLLAFTEGKQDPYVTWLSNLDRKLQLKYGRKRR